MYPVTTVTTLLRPESAATLKPLIGNGWVNTISIP